MFAQTSRRERTAAIGIWRCFAMETISRTFSDGVPLPSPHSTRLESKMRRGVAVTMSRCVCLSPTTILSLTGRATVFPRARALRFDSFCSLPSSVSSVLAALSSSSLLLTPRVVTSNGAVRGTAIFSALTLLSVQSGSLAGCCDLACRLAWIRRLRGCMNASCVQPCH